MAKSSVGNRPQAREMHILEFLDKVLGGFEVPDDVYLRG